jgi:hypothetical protein
VYGHGGVLNIVSWCLGVRFLELEVIRNSSGQSYEDKEKKRKIRKVKWALFLVSFLFVVSMF